MQINKLAKRFVQTIFVYLIGQQVVITYLIGNLNYMKPSPFPSQSPSLLGNETVTSAKIILIWTKFWGYKKKLWPKIFDSIINGRCPVSNCHFEYRHSHLDSADAVLFHPMDLYPRYYLPWTHRPDQPWIFLSFEAPPVLKGSHKKLLQHPKIRNIFNWTMTYRMDSDIVVPYGQFIPVKPETENKLRNFWKEKESDSLGAWMVSHCITNSRREVFMEEIQKHMKVDVFGKCGNKKCGKKLVIGTIGTFDQDVCNEEIRKHFFYFSLENAICTDYVTEKFYLALSLDVVPVVLGGADYSSIAPFHSYIDALAFQSPKDLATFLTSLAADEDSYNQFRTLNGKSTSQ